MTTITLRLAESDKRELDAIVNAMGMNMSTFFMIYAKQVLRERKIPFEISAPVDPLYSEDAAKRGVL